MGRQWIEYRQEQGIHRDMPPSCERSWFASPGNARNPRPHLRLTMPILENVGECPYWMPYREGDPAPALPECLLAKEA